MNSNQFLDILYYFKIISLILILFLLTGIMIYFKKLKIISKKIENIKNWFGVNPLLESSSKSLTKWREIEGLLTENYQSSWKLAVIKSEALVENFLKQIGYQGKTFTDLLEELKLRGYRNLEILQGTHLVNEEILNNKNYNLSQKEAINIIAIYKRFWAELTAKIL